MQEQVLDVIVVGAGVLGRSLALALAEAEPALRVGLSGPGGPGASPAAGAMLGVLGEVTAGALRTAHGRLRVDLAVEAGRRWPAWRRRIRALAGSAAPADGFGRGTFVLLNAVGSTLDQQSLGAIGRAGAEHGLPVEEVDPLEVPGVSALDNDRPLRALHLPDEAFLDARRWLATLDAALAALPNVVPLPAGRPLPHPDGYLLKTPELRATARIMVLATGAWTTQLVEELDPDLTLLPVVCTEGTAVTLTAPAALPTVLRTPNRAYACGLHAVPQADGTWYVGASANPALTPGTHPTPGALRFLLDAALGQLHHGLATARLLHVHHGNRPIGLDGHPLIGPTGRPGLWLLTGTHRDGLHGSPLIARELAAEILGAAPSAWLAPWRPDRTPIADWTADEAIAEAAAHHHALTAESRMRPPLSGSWPQALADAYHQQIADAYRRLPDGFVLPPDLAPLAYEHGPALAKLLARTIGSRRITP
ncbi:NAD(P)/FAD-dependent oxidoreductase [Kitasatospora sp. NPDC059747]|uniref:NAD(P)/FAD-dependent oxidoreductase n=2 Tax=unclassified Kitasatospora TaxID=2633591 RepID=UPI00364669E2